MDIRDPLVQHTRLPPSVANSLFDRGRSPRVLRWALTSSRTWRCSKTTQPSGLPSSVVLVEDRDRTTPVISERSSFSSSSITSSRAAEASSRSEPMSTPAISVVSRTYVASSEFRFAPISRHGRLDLGPESLRLEQGADPLARPLRGPGVSPRREPGREVVWLRIQVRHHESVARRASGGGARDDVPAARKRRVERAPEAAALGPEHVDRLEFPGLRIVPGILGVAAPVTLAEQTVSHGVELRSPWHVELRPARLGRRRRASARGRRR